MPPCSCRKGGNIIAKTDKCVVRNQAYRKAEFSIRERHNERKNESYGNGDILPERSSLNIQFKQCDGTYEQAFTRMVDSGAVSLRGLKAEAKVFDELVFDVNSAYFENHGGYEYAKQFFGETYRVAVSEAGGEEYILSAVMHADERNKALSEQLGRDIFHYHLHVVYMPVVDKEVYFKKNNKNPELAGKLKEVIKQVSHSKKWPRFKDENGHWVNSYSLLQDRFFEHMRTAGFTDFERGDRGSTTEHLSVLDYKIQQDTARLGVLDGTIADKEKQVISLDTQTEKKQERLSSLNEKISDTKQVAASVNEIDSLAKKTLGGNYQLAPDGWKKVSTLAKEAIKSRGIIAGLKEIITGLRREIAELKKKLTRYEGMGVTDTMRYYEAMQRAPRRLAETVADIKRQPPEKKDAEPERKRSQGLEM